MISKTGLVMVLVLLFIGTGLAKEAESKEKEKPKRTAVMKELQGEVTWVSKTKDRIAIVYSSTETGDAEILLPIDKNTVLHHKGNIADINRGDTVSIQYEEVTEETPDGVKSKRTAKAIYFIRAGK